MISYKSLSFMLAALLNAWISPSAAAADFPVRAITFVVPFSAGSAVDAYARFVAPNLSEALGQPVLVDNKEGAGGLIGAQAVLRAPADGYTYLFALPPWEYTPYFYKNPPYIPLKDFRAVARLGISPLVLMATPDAPFSDVPGLIAFAKRNPGKLTYASSGNGSASHLLAEQFKNAAQVDILHVPYKSTAQANTDVISGQISNVLQPHVGAAIYQGSEGKGHCSNQHNALEASAGFANRSRKRRA